jgi:hypothetical protein
LLPRRSRTAGFISASENARETEATTVQLPRGCRIFVLRADYVDFSINEAVTIDIIL